MDKRSQSDLLRYLVPAIVVALVVLAVLAAIVYVVRAGGESGETAAEETTTLAEAGAPPMPALAAGDLGLEPGAVSVFYSNSTSTPVNVDFALDGPWDFTHGPKQFKLTLSVVEADSAPQAEYFPDADVAVRASWEPPLIEEKYIFQQVAADAWLAYGSAGLQRVTAFTTPSTAMPLPAAVGDEWDDDYQVEENGNVVDVHAHNRLVAFNTLSVPAGDFDAFLLQIRVTSTNGQSSTTSWDYVWLVPGIGRAAEIVSETGEKDELFDRAYAFYRLEKHTAPR